MNAALSMWGKTLMPRIFTIIAIRSTIQYSMVACQFSGS